MSEFKNSDGLFSIIILVFSDLSYDSVIVFPSLNAVSHKVIFLQGTLFYFLTSLCPHLSHFFEYNISGKKKWFLAQLEIETCETDKIPIMPIS